MTDELYGKVCDAIEAVIDDQEAIKDRLSSLEKRVNDDLIGGIKSLYEENVRAEGIGKLKEGYGSKFGDIPDKFSNMFEGDLWEKLYDAVADVAEAEREPRIMAIYDRLAEKFKPAESAPVAAVSVETVAPPAEEKEAASEDDAESDIKKTVERLKRGRR